MVNEKIPMKMKGNFSRWLHNALWARKVEN